MSERPSVKNQSSRFALKVLTLISVCSLFVGLLCGVVLVNLNPGSMFGIGSSRTDGSVEIGHLAVMDTESYQAYTDKGGALANNQTESLVVAATYDITAMADEVDEELEAERKAAEEAAKREEEQKIAQAKKRIAEQEKSNGMPSGLSTVDWDCGKEAFIAEWTARIDAFLEGFPMEGYGKVFAEAAWNYGVDPRYSPAIANTESTRGKQCFKPYNAWGWGARQWTNWEDAINDHVKGLASDYGYTISLVAAKKYCPPTYNSWYNNTLWAMKQI